VQVLDFNTGIDFGAKGNLKEFSPAGFSSDSDEVSTWSEKPFVELAFRVPPLRRDLRVTVQVFPYVPDRTPVRKQDCWVFCNGLLVHFCSVEAPSEIEFTMSREILNPRANRLSFVLPDAVSPNELRLGDDLRKLALAFVRLSVAQA
jgi:hypothetical protein